MLLLPPPALRPDLRVIPPAAAAAPAGPGNAERPGPARPRSGSAAGSPHAPPVRGGAGGGRAEPGGGDGPGTGRGLGRAVRRQRSTGTGARRAGHGVPAAAEPRLAVRGGFSPVGVSPSRQGCASPSPVTGPHP